ncbi:unnamed protein product [Diatraea saccharalis]|uniref:Uncharacterized protein n=1 Tax=Diatraea saccharalis TaxID=40085 RepID=A0A9N9WDF2_9NEOP|nr:unnamed protein product [Diatraea saccharalis]
MRLAPMSLPKQYYANERMNKILKNATRLDGRRRGYDYNKEQPYEKGYDLNLTTRAMDMLRQTVYLTQYRMMHLQYVTDTYSTDISFRVGYIFSRLDKIIHDMRLLYTVMNKTTINDTTHNYYYPDYQTGFYTYLLYYSYFLKHNHDVTYIVEYLIELHTNIVKETREKTKKGTPKPGSEEPSFEPAGSDSDAGEADGKEGAGGGPAGGGAARGDTAGGGPIGGGPAGDGPVGGESAGDGPVGGRPAGDKPAGGGPVAGEPAGPEPGGAEEPAAGSPDQ